jgi:hypothetical protein
MLVSYSPSKEINRLVIADAGYLAELSISDADVKLKKLCDYFSAVTILDGVESSPRTSLVGIWIFAKFIHDIGKPNVLP